MARFLVTHSQTFTVEADDAREAEAVAEERQWPDTTDVQVEIIEGIKA